MGLWPWVHGWSGARVAYQSKRKCNSYLPTGDKASCINPYVKHKIQSPTPRTHQTNSKAVDTQMIHTHCWKPKTMPDGWDIWFVLIWDIWFHSWICLGFIMVEDFMDLIVAWLYLSPCWCSRGSLLKGGFRNSLRQCILNENFLIRYCSTAWWWFLASLDGEA